MQSELPTSELFHDFGNESGITMPEERIFKNIKDKFESNNKFIPDYYYLVQEFLILGKVDQLISLFAEWCNPINETITKDRFVPGNGKKKRFSSYL